MADPGEMAPGHLSKLTLELGRVSPERLRQRTSSIAHHAEDSSGHFPKSPTTLAMLEHSPAMAQADDAMDFYLGALGAGPYQNACVFFGIVALFTQELHYFLPEVVAVRPKFWCSGTNMSLGKQNPCLEPGTNDSCTSWEFNLRDRKVSIVSEWELVCGRAWWIERSALTYTLGAIVGIILAGILSDRFGRRTSLLICLLPMSAAGLSLSMASSPYLYTVLRFCVAVCVTPIAVISTVLISEVVAPRDLAVYVMAIQLGNSGASMALGWLHRTSAGWRFVIVIAMMPVLLLFFQFGSTSESPRWLVRTRDYNRAQRILLGAARKNGLEAIRALNLWTKARGILENLEITSPKTKPRPMYWLLWATWRWTTIILLTTWFTMGYVYYTVVLSYIRMTYDVFNFDVRGALGPPTLVLAYLLAETLGRRRSVALALAATGITAMLVFYFSRKAHTSASS
ncbi:solute carrier family 22 member 6-like [Dermacentor variabilis]|uniref:solute carrier family 22 member 6-like n=1 Tax=Dermacentor variabilis TaxID=34621 RepID=UPI003F5B483D